MKYNKIIKIHVLRAKIRVLFVFLKKHQKTRPPPCIQHPRRRSDERQQDDGRVFYVFLGRRWSWDGAGFWQRPVWQRLLLIVFIVVVLLIRFDGLREWVWYRPVLRPWYP